MPSSGKGTLFKTRNRPHASLLAPIRIGESLAPIGYGPLDNQFRSEPMLRPSQKVSSILSVVALWPLPPPPSPRPKRATLLFAGSAKIDPPQWHREHFEHLPVNTTPRFANSSISFATNTFICLSPLGATSKPTGNISTVSSKWKKRLCLKLDQKGH